MFTKQDKDKMHNLKGDGGKIKYSYAIRRIERENDVWPAYQIEIIAIQNGRVIKEELLDKPDTLNMILGKMSDLINPITATEIMSEHNSIKA
jgi:hypothetical protein